MRYLHPVQRHEKFVASGRYHFYREMLFTQESLDRAQAENRARDVKLEHEFPEEVMRFYQGLYFLNAVEEWSIHELPDGSRLVRCDSHNLDFRPMDGWLGEILYRTDGAVERVDMRCYFKSRLVAEASYLFFEELVLIGRKYLQQDGTMTEREQIERALPAGYLADSGMFTLTRGLTAYEMVKRQATNGIDEFMVFYPQEPEYEDIDVPLESALRGHTVSCKISGAGTENMMVGKREIEGVVYDQIYFERQPKQWGVDQWERAILIDKHGIPLSYPHRFVFTDRLEEYACRPEPESGEHRV